MPNNDNRNGKEKGGGKAGGSKGLEGLGGLSADDIALIAGVLVIVADVVALWAILKAREEKSSEETSSIEAIASLRGISKGTGGRSRVRGKSRVLMTKGRSFKI